MGRGTKWCVLGALGLVSGTRDARFAKTNRLVPDRHNDDGERTRPRVRCAAPSRNTVRKPFPTGDGACVLQTGVHRYLEEVRLSFEL